MRIITCLLCVLTAVCALCGCMGPVALSKALPDYDETINQLEGKALLLNIARSRYFMPPHFTDTTSVVATFNFRADASAGGQFSNKSSNADATVTIGAAVEENPTIELTPLRGDKFEKQLLTPLTDNQFRLLATEGLPLDLLIRLMGKAFQFQNEEGAIIGTARNDPAFPQEYEMFRQIALHIAALNTAAKLHAGRVSFVETDELILTQAPTASDVLAARKSGYDYQALGGNKYVLSQQVIGNTVVTNFDTSLLSDAQRVALNTRISLTPSNLVDIEIRGGFPGGDFPLSGVIQLRSFSEILDFIGRGIVNDLEFNVAPDVHTTQILQALPDIGIVKLNPKRVLTIKESTEEPQKGVLEIKYRDAYYWVQQDPWDTLAFKSLYLLMQMSSQASTERAFPITISK